MNKIKQDFLQYFVKKFNLIIFEQNETKSSFATLSQISDLDIEETFTKFFTEKNFSVKKLAEGVFSLYQKEKKRLFVYISNFSGKEPNLIYISFLQ